VMLAAVSHSPECAEALAKSGVFANFEKALRLRSLRTQEQCRTAERRKLRLYFLFFLRLPVHEISFVRPSGRLKATAWQRGSTGPISGRSLNSDWCCDERWCVGVWLGGRFPDALLIGVGDASEIDVGGKSLGAFQSRLGTEKKTRAR